MRFPVEALALTVLLAALPCAAAGTAPTQPEIDRAAEAAKTDPALASEKSVRSLRWKSAREATEKKPDARGRNSMPEWLRWIGDLFSWIAQASRLLMWIIIAGLLCLLVLLILRIVKTRGSAPRAPRFFAPTHVQDLDIRPESLPDDIGAAAHALWDGGKQRAALALLYRGLLSRLAHTHRVAIRDSSTEGDCLALAAGALDERRLQYATRLVRVWQSAIYGGVVVDTPVVHEVCAGFAQHLDLATPPADAATAGASA